MTREFLSLALALAVASAAPGPALAQTEPPSSAQTMYAMPAGTESRWTSPENHSGAKGEGARANDGIKGNAYDVIPPHGHVDVLNVTGPGIVQRMKMSVIDRSPEMLRSMRIEMFWDGADKPAVRAPLGDFFGTAFGKTAEYETSLFKDPEGRSFTFTIPMPFRKGARIVIYNDSDKPVTHLYYNVNFQKWDHAPENMLYFHAYWHRNTPALGKDFEVLPEVHGSGRFLGASIGVKANPVYGSHKKGEAPLHYWWGEGEVKLWLDGDQANPSMVGTGVEDYFGTAWGMGHFVTLNSGCTIADPATLHWSCYRYHVPDPIWFHQDIRVAMQQIGGGPREQVRQMVRDGAPLIPISVDGSGEDHHFYPLLSMKNPPKLMDNNFPEGWTNYFRSDDWCATAYFYLDTPTDGLPALQPLPERLKNL